MSHNGPPPSMHPGASDYGPQPPQGESQALTQTNHAGPQYQPGYGYQNTHPYPAPNHYPAPQHGPMGPMMGTQMNNQMNPYMTPLPYFPPPFGYAQPHFNPYQMQPMMGGYMPGYQPQQPAGPARPPPNQPMHVPRAEPKKEESPMPVVLNDLVHSETHSVMTRDKKGPHSVRPTSSLQIQPLSHPDYLPHPGASNVSRAGLPYESEAVKADGKRPRARDEKKRGKYHRGKGSRVSVSREWSPMGGKVTFLPSPDIRKTCIESRGWLANENVSVLVRFLHQGYSNPPQVSEGDDFQLGHR